MHFGALRLVALQTDGSIEEALATENEREIVISTPAHVDSAHAALCRWSAAFSPEWIGQKSEKTPGGGQGH